MSIMAAGRNPLAFKDSGTVKFVAPGIYAQGADAAAGEFFVVVTIGRGKPPEALVRGEGLGAKVTIGKRTVAFDGQRIIFGLSETGER